MSKIPRQRRIIVEALEPRLMFSATADIAVFHDSSSDVNYLAEAAANIDLAQVYNLPEGMPATEAVDNSSTTSAEVDSDLAVATYPPAPPTPSTTAHIVPDSPGLTTSTEPSALSVEEPSALKVDMADTVLVAMARSDDPSAGSATVLDSLANAPVFVFVDITVDNYQALVKDIEDNSLGQNITIFYLRPDQDGFQQIAAALGNQTNVAAIHLITHGSAETFQLGSEEINQHTLDQYADELSAWQKSLSEEADILIYGCDLAATEAGQQLVAQIGQLTLADIAASNDLTGSAARNGDWDLEVHYGSIETHVLISAQMQQDWNSILVADVHYMEQLTGTSSQQFYNNNNVGQQFMISGSGTFTLNQVGVQLKALAGANYQEITILIRSTWNNATNIAMSSNVVASTSLSGDFEWYAFDFSNITLNKNQNYVIQMYSVYPTNFGGTTDGKVAAAYVANPGVLANTQMVSGISSGTYSGGDLAFILAYDNGNQTPYVNTPIADQNATEKVAFSYQFTASNFKDDDFQDRLTYTATLASGAALPSWLSFNPSTLTFSGTPGVNDAGTLAVKLTASDGQATTSDTFNIAIANNNVAPTVANAIPDQNANEDAAFAFQFSSSAFNDSDADPLTYTATLSGGGALPSWLTFNAATRTFSGTPTNSDLGTLSVEVTANDNQGGSISDSFTITTANTNDAPTLANLIPNKAATEDSAFNFQFAANTFADVDVGDTLSYTATLSNGAALPAWLSFNAATRTFSGTPLNADVGTISVKVTASDGNGGTINDTFDIVVANTNDAPTLPNPIADQGATEDTAFNFQFAANTFNDVDASDTLTYTATLSGGAALPSWLSFNAATRTFSGSPANGDVGTISIQVTADDSQGGTATDTFAIVIANSNDAPTVANSIPDRSATEDAVFSYQFAANTFADVDAGATLTYTATLSGGSPLPAWLIFNPATRTFSGTPLNADVGTLSIEVTANDGQGGTVADSFDIVVANSNDAPTVPNAIPDQAGTQNAAFNFSFAPNTFADVDLGDTLTYSATIGGAPLPAWLSFNAATRTFSGTPGSTDVGTINVQVTADDGHGGTVNDTFAIVIANVNDAPVVAHSIPNRTAVENLPFNYQFAANTFSDVDGDTLTYSAQVAGGGPLPAWLSFNPATRTFFGTPAPTDIGATIEVIASDGFLTVTDTFVLGINNVNNAPTLDNPIPDQSATEDTAFNFSFAANTFSDTDPTDTLTYTATLVGGAPLPAWLTFNATTGTFSGTPLNANVGAISILVTADDGNLTVTDTFDIVIANTNDAPVVATAIPDQGATEDAAFNFQFAANSFNDVDAGATLSYTATLAGGGALPTWLSFNAATGTFSGTPANGDVGTLSVKVTADDGLGGSVADTFNIVVSNSNDAPTVANPIGNQNATEDAAFNFSFAANTFSDVDVGDTLTYTATLAGGALPLPSWLNFNAATHTFSGTPLNGNVGTLSIDVTATDGNGGTIVNTFDIVVANSNDAPTVPNAIPNQNATEDTAFTFQFSGTAFNDVDLGDTLSYSAQLAGGGLLPTWLSFDDTTRTFSGTPLNGDVGNLAIAVIASDGQGGTVTDTFIIVVANSNDAPTVTHAIPPQNATEDTAFNFQFAANTFNDVDSGNTLTYSATLAGGAPLPAWLSFNAGTRSFSGTPLNGDVNTIAIAVTANDSQGGTVIETFTIAIANTNDAPTVAHSIPDQNATEDSAFNFQFSSATFSDADLSDTLTYSALVGGGPLPSWLSFDASTRTFSGTPLNGDVGTLNIQVTAADGQGGSVTDNFAIVIGNTNDAPVVVHAIPEQMASEDTAFNFQFSATTFNDVDAASTLTYTASLSGGGALPSWLNFNAATRTFSGTPLNSDLGSISIKVTANDGEGGIVNNVFTLIVANSNDTPTLANSIPDQAATEDSTFSFQFAADTFADDDVGDSFTYTATLAGGAALPSWLHFNAATRTFSGTPLNADVGTLAITVSASDGSANISDSFSLAIANTNDAPLVANAIPEQNATEDVAFIYQIPANTFVDVDAGSALSYSVSLAGGGALPSWLSFNAATRTFSGTPDNNDVGSLAIQVTVDDGLGGSVSDTFTLAVINSNDAPTLANSIPNQAVAEDSVFIFQFAGNTFSDVDAGSSLSYSAQQANGAALPSWLNFDATTRSFSGIPLNADVGTISIMVTASDGQGGTLSTQFDIAVANTPDAPTLISPIANILIEANQQLHFVVPANTFHDDDLGDSLSYSLQLPNGENLPTWLSFDPTTMTLSGKPSADDVGSVILLNLRASDSTGNNSDTSFVVLVDKEASLYIPDTTINIIEKPPLPNTPALIPPAIIPLDNQQTTSDGTITAMEHNSFQRLSSYGNNLPLLQGLNDDMPDVDRNNIHLMDIRSALSLSNSSPLLASLIAPDAGFSTADTEDFNSALRRFHSDMNEVMDAEEMQKNILSGITLSVTTGLVIWSLRASSLLLTLMSMIPLWSGMDPLPILDQVNKRKQELKQQRKDKQKEDENAKEVGYLFDQTQPSKNHKPVK